MKLVKELTARQGSNGIVRYHFDGKSIGIANIVKLIEDYCRNGSYYELRANVKIFENPKAQSLRNLSVNDLAKIEWLSGNISPKFMKPVAIENGVDFVLDEIKNAEAETRYEIFTTIHGIARLESAEQEKAAYSKLAELAKEYPAIFSENVEYEKAKAEQYADWSKNTGRKNILEKLEEILASIQSTAENESSKDDLAVNSPVSNDAEINEVADKEDELVDAPAAENQVIFPVVPDQFAALELADDYFPELHISGKITKSNGTLTAINNDGVTVSINDEFLEINSENGTWRIDYDIAESTFCAALREVTLKAITEGKMQDTFEIVGKSGLIYTYTEATLKPIRAETPEEHDARINTAPKQIVTFETVPAKVNELWKILRQKQQALKAIMAEKNIVAARKYSAKIAEIKLIIDAINTFTKTAAA